jgi:hypothetical protein
VAREARVTRYAKILELAEQQVPADRNPGDPASDDNPSAKQEDSDASEEERDLRPESVREHGRDPNVCARIAQILVVRVIRGSTLNLLTRGQIDVSQSKVRPMRPG